jgi:hypothetical protein
MNSFPTRTKLATAVLLSIAPIVPAWHGVSTSQHLTKPDSTHAVAVQTVDIRALWHDPIDIPSLNLAFGQGGSRHAPREGAAYKFVKEDLGGSSPKFYIEDNDGVEWLAKVGDEARGETAATRIVWAMGYFSDEDYFVAELHVSGMPKLHRKSKAISRNGTVRGARLERREKGEKKVGNWQWLDNPFLNTRELNGLKVLMALLNNWDLKTSNNKVYEEKDGELHYVVSDLGASFGRTGAIATRSKGNLKDYKRDPFIQHQSEKTVDFVMRTKPFPLTDLFRRRYYKEKVQIAEVTKNVPLVDAKWIGSQLSKLSSEQIREALRTSGFLPEEVDAYTEVIEKRIAELTSL